MLLHFYKIREKSEIPAKDLFSTIQEQDTANLNITDLIKEYVLCADFSNILYDNEKFKCNTTFDSENNITLLQIENNRKKTTVVDQEEYTHEHHPYSNIVIFVKDNIPYVAIEKGGTFKTDTKKGIIENCINGKILPDNIYYKGIELIPIIQVRSFENQVNFIIDKTNDNLKGLTIKNIGKKDIYKNNMLNSIINPTVSDYIAETIHNIKVEENTPMERLCNLIRNVSVLVEKNMNDFSLSAQFSNYGTLNYSKEFHMAYLVKDDLIEDFKGKKSKKIRQVSIFDEIAPKDKLAKRLHEIIEEMKEDELVIKT